MKNQVEKKVTGIEVGATTEQFEWRVKSLEDSYMIGNNNSFARDVVASIWEQFGPYDPVGMIDVIFEACISLPEDQKKNYKEFIGYLIKIYKDQGRGFIDFKNTIYDNYSASSRDGKDSRYPSFGTYSGLFDAIKKLSLN